MRRGLGVIELAILVGIAAIVVAVAAPWWAASRKRGATEATGAIETLNVG